MGFIYHNFNGSYSEGASEVKTPPLALMAAGYYNLTTQASPKHLKSTAKLTKLHSVA